MNSVNLIGRLTRDPEVQFTKGGIAYCNLTLAIDRRVKDHEGNKQTDFIPCIAWRKTAELCGQYLNKGSQVAIRGELQQENYTDKEGNKRTAYKVMVEEVQFLGSRGESTPRDQPDGQPDVPPPDDSDLPF